jgi:hypothetical protein
MPTRAEFKCAAPLVIDAKCQGLSPDKNAYRCLGCTRQYEAIRGRARKGAFGVARQLAAKREEMAAQLNEPGITANFLHREWTDKVESIYTSLFARALVTPNAPTFALCICGSLARREACPYSDIDSFLVLEDTSDKTVEFFQRAALEVNQCLLELRGDVNGFRLCTDLNPFHILETPEGLIRMLHETEVVGKATAAHELSVKEARFLSGSLELYNEYQRALAEYKKVNRGSTLENALTSIRQGIKDMRYLPDPSKDNYLNVKADLYRLVQVMLRDLAAYHGIDAPDGRGQVEGLVKAGHMSVGVSNLAINMLEDVGKLRLKTQLGQKGHVEGIYMGVPSNMDDKGPGAIANKADMAMINALRDRLRIWKKLAEDFIAEVTRFQTDVRNAHDNRPKGINALFSKKVKVKPLVNPYLIKEPRTLLG